ncbi:MAG TPA: hypothetical protein VGC79_11015 [Polyangiaceae bacterium]
MPLSRWVALAICLTAAALALGCTPKIGDDCTVSTNCSTTGVRLCDVTQPGGYCTIFNCEPGSCPDDAKCVNFGTELSPVPGCQPSQANSPYKRSFCMASCSTDSDCRDREGYRCRAPDDFHAVLAEHESGSKVCVIPLPSAEQTGSNQVCIVADAGPVEDDSSSTAGTGGGSSSLGGAGGSSGAAVEAGAAGDGGSGG